MYKEVIISIIIVIMILGLNFITQNYTNNTVSQMKEYLDNTRGELTKEAQDYDMASKKADETLKKWEELDDKIALYVEHDEIEKVKTAITSMQSFIEMKDDSQAVDSIDRCKYILEHIAQKEEFSIDNIF
ncbi:MAG: DUF4363 family protein [Clostridia bacterium]|nr:DUF4363 family protein [Clostridia bacterium]